jgi:hypothetical protein
MKVLAMFWKKEEPFIHKKKQVIDELLDYLCEKHEGFIRIKNDERIEKKEGDFVHVFSFLIYYSYGTYRIDPFVGIRYDPINDFEFQVNKLKYNNLHTTIGNRICAIKKYEYISKGFISEQFEIDSVKSFNKTKVKLSSELAKMNESYFKKFSSVEMIHQALNKYPNDNSVHSKGYYLRFRFGIIAAKLALASNLNELIEIYRSTQIENKMMDELAYFENVVQQLDQLNSEINFTDNTFEELNTEQQTKMGMIDKIDWHLNEALTHPEMGGVHIGFYFNWIVDHDMYGELHEDEFLENIQEVKDKEITGLEYIIDICDEKFWDEDLNEEGLNFTEFYYETYLDDFATYCKDHKESIYTPEKYWFHYEQISKMISKRFEDWKT